MVTLLYIKLSKKFNVYVNLHTHYRYDNVFKERISDDCSPKGYATTKYMLNKMTVVCYSMSSLLTNIVLV